MSGDFPQAESANADIVDNMKALAVVYAGNISPYALKPLKGGASALHRAVCAASSFPGTVKTVIFADSDESFSGSSGLPAGIETVRADSWTPRAFFAALAPLVKGFDHLYLVHGDEPYLDIAFASKIAEQHTRYAAEYSFADGYPLGLAPQILASGLVPVLERLASDDTEAMTRDFLFETIKKDINSFDIETEISPVDHRQLRLVLACDSKRNYERTSAFYGITAENCAALLTERSDALYGLPAFYALQVAGRCPFECPYCPYPAFCRSGEGISPGISAAARQDFMPVDRFAYVMDRIAEYSEDAVVSLSLQGEASFHPDVPSLFRSALRHPGLTVLVETTGIGWTDATLRGIAEEARSASPRIGERHPVEWIVSLDSVSPDCYSRLKGLGGIQEAGAAERLFNEAQGFISRAESLFPGHVWPQTVRMKDNEEELEPFYRLWNGKLGRVIVQKHDHFCGSVQERRVADLSPLVRHPCWHLKRDMSILMDGTVPLCKEDLYALNRVGNAFTDSLAAIRDRLQPRYERQCSGNYEGLCSACDEYYTYNF